MTSPDLSNPQPFSMANSRTNRSVFSISKGYLVACLAFFSVLLLCSFWSTFVPSPYFHRKFRKLPGNPNNCDAADRSTDSDELSFYDDPHFSYSIEKPIENWDEKRREWFKHHPSFAAGAKEKILLVTGSQPPACENPIGDHLLLRLFKNKVDYCRIQGIEIFYSNSLLHPKMNSYWAKLPVIRAAMVSHPEVEWIWWVDSDALFTDMEFKLPLDRYRNHNLVVHGWPSLIFYSKSWTALNAGVFLIRNCQWSLDFMNVWANMGPMSDEYPKWGPIQRSIFKDKTNPESDDQTALIYMLYKHKNKYMGRVYLESGYYFQAYWVGVVGKFNDTMERYLETERKEKKLRRRHAEAVSEHYAEVREKWVERDWYPGQGWERPFVTHFTGCQPCNGNHNPMYEGDSCWREMERALNFADNQVLRKFGFVHSNLRVSSPVEVPFDFPSDQGRW